MGLDVTKYERLAVGSQIRFSPQENNRWWTVEASSERFLVCSQQAKFRARGELWHCIVDLVGWDTAYNNTPPGPVRSSCNLLGGGYDTRGDGWAESMLAELESGRLGLSRRRAVVVNDIEVKK